MELTKTIEHISFENIANQELKQVLDQFGGSLKFESVGKSDYQVTIALSNLELQERIVTKNLPTKIVKLFFIYRIHGMIAQLLGGIYPL